MVVLHPRQKGKELKPDQDTGQNRLSYVALLPHIQTPNRNSPNVEGGSEGPYEKETWNDGTMVLRALRCTLKLDILFPAGSGRRGRLEVRSSVTVDSIHSLRSN